MEPPSASETERAERVASFFDWLRAQPDVLADCVRFDAARAGLVLTRAVSDADKPLTLLSIPRRLIYTGEYVRSPQSSLARLYPSLLNAVASALPTDEIARDAPLTDDELARAQHQFTSNRTLLYVGMLAELADGDGVFGEYFRSLPTSYNLPLCWTDAELALLDGTHLFSSAGRWRQRAELDLQLLRSMYQRACAELPPGGNGAPPPPPPLDLSEAAWHWAICSYMSRAFTPRAVGQQVDGRPGVMCPLLDLINRHPDADRTVEWRFEPERFSFVAVAPAGGRAAGPADDDFSPVTGLRGYQPGDELYICYEPRVTTERLIYSYGFMLQRRADGLPCADENYPVLMNVRVQGDDHDGDGDHDDDGGGDGAPKIEQKQFLIAHNGALPKELLEAISGA